MCCFFEHDSPDMLNMRQITTQKNGQLSTKIEFAVHIIKTSIILYLLLIHL